VLSRHFVAPKLDSNGGLEVERSSVSPTIHIRPRHVQQNYQLTIAERSTGCATRHDVFFAATEQNQFPGVAAAPQIASIRLFTGDSTHQIDVASCFQQGHNYCMTQKQLVLNAINDLPDDAPLSDIVERIEFLAAVQKGLDQLDQGLGIPHDEVKRQLASWR
jgi:predicted transcriptional regulator